MSKQRPFGETTLRGCAGAWGPPTLPDQELRQNLRCSDATYITSTVTSACTRGSDRSVATNWQPRPSQAHSHRGAPAFISACTRANDRTSAIFADGLAFHLGRHALAGDNPISSGFTAPDARSLPPTQVQVERDARQRTWFCDRADAYDGAEIEPWLFTAWRIKCMWWVLFARRVAKFFCVVAQAGAGGDTSSRLAAAAMAKGRQVLRARPPAKQAALEMRQKLARHVLLHSGERPYNFRADGHPHPPPAPAHRAAPVPLRPVRHGLQPGGQPDAAQAQPHGRAALGAVRVEGETVFLQTSQLNGLYDGVSRRWSRDKCGLGERSK
ncbi:Protein of unknown function [Gryllus bimaculatus]|nr:Protein of unknown function [Gryllus bimaculatus]